MHKGQDFLAFFRRSRYSPSGSPGGGYDHGPFNRSICQALWVMRTSPLPAKHSFPSNVCLRLASVLSVPGLGHILPGETTRFREGYEFSENPIILTIYGFSSFMPTSLGTSRMQQSGSIVSKSTPVS